VHTQQPTKPLMSERAATMDAVDCGARRSVR
jgi:hypothetical protein